MQSEQLAAAQEYLSNREFYSTWANNDPEALNHLRSVLSEATAARSRIVELEQHVQRVSARWSVLIANIDDKSLIETVERVADENLALRELAREWRDAFETSNVKAVPNLKQRTEELGL